MYTLLKLGAIIIMAVFCFRRGYISLFKTKEQLKAEISKIPKEFDSIMKRNSSYTSAKINGILSILVGILLIYVFFLRLSEIM